MTAAPIAPVEAVAAPALAQPAASAAATPATSFAQMLLTGVDHVNQKALDADAMVRAFVLDDTVPVHQVTYALEEAQSSLALALQVRSRLLDAYQQLMNMQL